MSTAVPRAATPDGPESDAVVTAPLHSPLPPRGRAGVYELLAELPGVRAAEGIPEDLSGRPTAGVAHDVEEHH